MADITGFLRGSLLKASDLNTPVITRVTGTQVKQFPDSERPTLILITDDGGITLNKTRLAACVAAWGGDDTAWTGKRVKLVRGVTKFQGKTIDCIDLVCAGSAPKPETRPAPIGDDDIPF